MAAEPPGLVQGETSGLGLRGNQELSGNTVGSPEHSALWAPGSTWVAHAVREMQLPVSHSTWWPKVRDKRTRTRTHREEQAINHWTRGALRESKASNPGRRGQREAEVCYGWQLSGQWHPRAHPCLWISKTQRQRNCFSFGLSTVVRERKEEVNKAAGWGIQALAPAQAPTAQSSMAQPAFLLG